jgi:NAD(P)-dependent dehydrogenase (short-subunit alcohol dehydrogenase family)
MSTKFPRSILITGGTSGLGYQCAIHVARGHPDYQIVIASRSDQSASTAAINQLLGQKNVMFLPLDLSSISQVKSFATEWEAKQFPPIHSLVFNAALQFPGDVKYTVDGFEKTFGISHIGHALLFALLRCHLADTARVVIVSSGTHDPAQKSGLPDAYYSSAEELAHPTKESSQNKGRQRYATTKLANVLYTYALHRRFEAINKKARKHWTVVAFDPGMVPGTGLGRDGSAIERFLWLKILPKVLPLLRLLVHPNIQTPEYSGQMLARLVLESDQEIGSGVYYEGPKRIKSSEASYDEVKQEDLWHWTVKSLANNESEVADFDFRDLL